MGLEIVKESFHQLQNLDKYEKVLCKRIFLAEDSFYLSLMKASVEGGIETALGRMAVTFNLFGLKLRWGQPPLWRV